jgi:hypothetical protein
MCPLMYIILQPPEGNTELRGIYILKYYKHITLYGIHKLTIIPKNM